MHCMYCLRTADDFGHAPSLHYSTSLSVRRATLLWPCQLPSMLPRLLQVLPSPHPLLSLLVRPLQRILQSKPLLPLPRPIPIAPAAPVVGVVARAGTAPPAPRLPAHLHPALSLTATPPPPLLLRPSLHLLPSRPNLRPQAPGLSVPELVPVPLRLPLHSNSNSKSRGLHGYV